MTALGQKATRWLQFAASAFAPIADKDWLAARDSFGPKADITQTLLHLRFLAISDMELTRNRGRLARYGNPPLASAK